MGANRKQITITMNKRTVTVTIEGDSLPESNDWLIGLSRGYGHPAITGIYTNDFIKEVDTLRQREAILLERAALLDGIRGQRQASVPELAKMVARHTELYKKQLPELI